MSAIDKNSPEAIRFAFQEIQESLYSLLTVYEERDDSQGMRCAPELCVAAAHLTLAMLEADQDGAS